MKIACELISLLISGSLTLAACTGGQPEMGSPALATTAAPSPATPSPSPVAPTRTPNSLPSAPEATFTPTGSAGQVVEFRTEDEILLFGTLYPADSDLIVILAHMGGSNQKAWQPFAVQIAALGLPALTFDFRCHGESGCDTSNNFVHLKDVRAAIQYVRSLGFRRVVCVGASLGAVACMNATLSEDLAGLGLFASGPAITVDGKTFPEDMFNPDIPKLFLVSENDHFSQVRAAMPDLYQKAPQPKAFVRLPGREHGTDLFKTEIGPQYSQVIIDFLLEVQAAGSSQPVSLALPTPVATLPPLVELADLTNGQGPVYSQAWSPDGRWLAAAGYSEVNLWEVEKRSLQVLKGHSGYVWGVDWSPDGATLASASQDQSVRLWDSATLTQTALLQTGWAFSVDWSPDGVQLAVGTYFDGLQIWDAA